MKNKLNKNKIISLLAILFLVVMAPQSDKNPLLSPIGSSVNSPVFSEENMGYEIFGFAPYWTINKLDNVDFNTLTTLAYFGITINCDGSFDKTDDGYRTYKGEKAERLFDKAHSHGVKVLLTLIQMDNYCIRSILDSDSAQQSVITQTVNEVKRRNLDGVNLDFEYGGNPGQEYRDKYSEFAKNMTDAMHEEIPGSKVSVSVYAASAKDPKMYDVKALGNSTDGVFMMAYDFATTVSDNAIPTAPLYGHKEGKYWYDVATAVEDFLKLMPADKLIMGVPYYGYNYLVYSPKVKSETLPNYTWRGRAVAQTYSDVVKNVNRNSYEYVDGWDDHGKVGWKAYFDPKTSVWRMIFLEDKKSLSMKYDLIKENNLQGVGIWALGFDNGKTELWQLLKDKFGGNLAKSLNVKFAEKS